MNKSNCYNHCSCHYSHGLPHLPPRVVRAATKMSALRTSHIAETLTWTVDDQKPSETHISYNHSHLTRDPRLLNGCSATKMNDLNDSVLLFGKRRFVMLVCCSPFAGWIQLCLQLFSDGFFGWRHLSVLQDINPRIA